MTHLTLPDGDPFHDDAAGMSDAMDRGGPLAELAALLGPSGLRAGAAEMAPYLVDWKGEHRGRALAVARPSSTEEVAAVVRHAARHGLAVVPQGGRTGLAAGATPDGSPRNLVLSLERMTGIRAVDRTGLSVTVEAGAVIDAVRAALREVGRDLPISFGASGSATVGGVIATNAGGANVLRYGMAGRMVLGLRTVLADGTVVGGTRALHKDNAGLNWTGLLAGPEGTLAVVTEAVLRIHPLPRHAASAFLSVDDPAAALTLYELAQDEVGERLSAFELMSGAAVARAAALDRAPPIALAPWMLLVEATSVSASVEADFAAFVETAFERGLIGDGALAASEGQRQAFWALRESLTEAEAKAGRAAKHDVSVPVTDIPDFLHAVTAALAGLDPALDLNVFGHVGDGNLHCNVIGVTPATVPGVNRAVHDVVARFGGSISAEHGIGQYRLDEARRLTPAAEQTLQRRLKAALDPEGRMNPGKLVP